MDALTMLQLAGKMSLIPGAELALFWFIDEQGNEVKSACVAHHVVARVIGGNGEGHFFRFTRKRPELGWADAPTEGKALEDKMFHR